MGCNQPKPRNETLPSRRSTEPKANGELLAIMPAPEQRNPQSQPFAVTKPVPADDSKPKKSMPEKNFEEEKKPKGR